MRRRRVWAWLAAAVLAVVVLPAGVGAHDDDEAERRARVDLQVAVRVGERCAEFRDSLPPLFIDPAMDPGDESYRVDLCLRNAGKSTGRVTLGVVDRVETETACTGDEASVDPTCADGAAGELGDSLVVVMGRTARCRGTTTEIGQVGFTSLSVAPAPLLGELRGKETECVSLRLANRPPSVEAGVAAQTDRVTWRFAFDLTN